MWAGSNLHNYAHFTQNYQTFLLNTLKKYKKIYQNKIGISDCHRHRGRTDTMLLPQKTAGIPQIPEMTWSSSLHIRFHGVTTYVPKSISGRVNKEEPTFLYYLWSCVCAPSLFPLHKCFSYLRKRATYVTFLILLLFNYLLYVYNFLKVQVNVYIFYYIYAIPITNYRSSWSRVCSAKCIKTIDETNVSWN